MKKLVCHGLQGRPRLTGTFLRRLVDAAKAPTDSSADDLVWATYDLYKYDMTQRENHGDVDLEKRSFLYFWKNVQNLELPVKSGTQSVKYTASYLMERLLVAAVSSKDGSPVYIPADEGGRLMDFGLAHLRRYKHQQGLFIAFMPEPMVIDAGLSYYRNKERGVESLLESVLHTMFRPGALQPTPQNMGNLAEVYLALRFVLENPFKCSEGELPHNPLLNGLTLPAWVQGASFTDPEGLLDERHSENMALQPLSQNVVVLLNEHAGIGDVSCG